MRQFALAAALVLLGSASAVAQAPKADPWLARTTATDFDLQRGPDTPVRVAVPRKDWMVLPTGRSVLFVMAARKGDAVVMVERTPLSLPLEPDDVTEVLAQIQIDTIKSRETRASDFEPRVIDAGERRLVAVQYKRPGALGAERVRQYSLPIGKWLYHITCAASGNQFVSYEPLFAHIAGSFAASE